MTFSPKSNFRLFTKTGTTLFFPFHLFPLSVHCIYKLLTTVIVIKLQHEVRKAAISTEIRKLKNQREGEAVGAGSGRGLLPVEELPENSAVGVASTPHPDVFLQTQILHLMLHSEDRRHTIHSLY